MCTKLLEDLIGGVATLREFAGARSQQRRGALVRKCDPSGGAEGANLSAGMDSSSSLKRAPTKDTTKVCCQT